METSRILAISLADLPCTWSCNNESHLSCKQSRDHASRNRSIVMLLSSSFRICFLGKVTKNPEIYKETQTYINILNVNALYNTRRLRCYCIRLIVSPFNEAMDVRLRDVYKVLSVR